MEGRADASSLSARAACPRCAYDLAGVVAAWPGGTAPQRGTCSECGLDFAWQDLLDPKRQRCSGLFEHARTAREQIRWFFRTLAWMVWPGVYWSRVQMHHEARTRSLAVRLLGAVVVLHLLAGGVHALGCTIGTAWWVPELGWMDPRGAVYAHVVLQPIAGVDVRASWGAGGLVRVGRSMWLADAIALACMIGMWPLMFLALPITRSLAKVHWGHIGRAALTPVMWLVVLLALRAGFIVLCVGYSAVFAEAAKRWPAWHASLPDPNMNLFRRAISLWADVLQLAMLGLMLWLIVWWGFAILRGWRIAKGWLVFFLLAIAAVLSAVGFGMWARFMTVGV